MGWLSGATFFLRLILMDREILSATTIARLAEAYFGRSFLIRAALQIPIDGTGLS
jgi:hypothetical protein